MSVEQPETPASALMGHHHVTVGVGDPQEDFDFHTKVLGLKCVKRTLLYGTEVEQLESDEIFSLYYAPVRLDWDTRDDLLDPTRGWRVLLGGAPYVDSKP